MFPAFHVQKPTLRVAGLVNGLASSFTSSDADLICWRNIGLVFTLRISPARVVVTCLPLALGSSVSTGLVLVLVLGPVNFGPWPPAVSPLCVFLLPYAVWEDRRKMGSCRGLPGVPGIELGSLMLSMKRAWCESPRLQPRASIGKNMLRGRGQERGRISTCSPFKSR